MTEYARCKCNQSQAQRLHDDPNYKPEFHDPGECPNGKADVFVCDMQSMSIVHWSRNAMVMKMRPKADYALFVDADMGLEVDTLDRLLMHKKDIVAGLCTRRTDPAVPNIREFVEEAQQFGELVTWEPNKLLLDVPAVGTGVMLISRRCLEDVAEYYSPEQYHSSGNGWWFENLTFSNLAGGRAEAGEDCSFCLKAHRIGYKVWVDTTIQPLHYDLYGYSMADFLPYQEERVRQVRERIAAQESKTSH
jgi:hypothetical protein